MDQGLLNNNPLLSDVIQTFDLQKFLLEFCSPLLLAAPLIKVVFQGSYLRPRTLKQLALGIAPHERCNGFHRLQLTFEEGDHTLGDRHFHA